MKSDFQLIFNKIIEIPSLVSSLEDFTGMIIETLDVPKDHASAFMMVEFYDQGLPMSIHLMWNPEHTPEFDIMQLIKYLSKKHNTLIATDLPEDDPFASNPYYWLVIQSSGEAVRMQQDTSVDTDGLILFLEPI